MGWSPLRFGQMVEKVDSMRAKESMDSLDPVRKPRSLKDRTAQFAKLTLLSSLRDKCRIIVKGSPFNTTILLAVVSNSMVRALPCACVRVYPLPRSCALNIVSIENDLSPKGTKLWPPHLRG